FCNEIPVGNIRSSFVLNQQEIREKGQPAKLDILWVVDDSPSMCQEQQSLASSFKTFLSTFKKYTAIDMQLAVTTTNVCVKEKPHIRGKFVYQPADDSTISPECVEKRVLPCLKRRDGTDDCPTRPELKNLDPQNWVCEDKPAKFLYSCDKPAEYGTDPHEGDVLFVVNSMCRYKCNKETAPASCGDTFGATPACDDACKSGTFDAAKCPAPGTAGCGYVADTSWACFKKCESYLHDATKCEQVCKAADCYGACTYAGDPASGNAGANFPKQDFLCTLACDDSYECDARCIAEFGKPTYRCLYPGGDNTRAGCLLPPATQYCPPKATGPKVLTKGDPACCVTRPDDPEFATRCRDGVADGSVTCTWFKAWQDGKWGGDPGWKEMDPLAVYDSVFELIFSCMATVGSGQLASPCGNQEQGLEAAWKALDPSGENAAQAKAFHRPDAYLLIVIVSDEEDCSSDDGAVKAESYGTCGCLPDHNGCKADGTCGHAPGPLIPPEEYVNRFKSLKPDPAMVVFATINGDVVADTPTSPVPEGQEDKIRERYYDCKCLPQATAYSPLTYACLSAQGKADLGNRYMRVARGFGPEYGQTSNICDDRGLAPSLENIAELVIPLLTSICLPRPIAEDEVIEVYKIDGEGNRTLQVPSTATEKHDFRVTQLSVCGTYEDVEPGDRLDNTIIFEQPLEFDDQVEFNYRAKTFHGQ
ncbi:MAG: hypothetical protein FJ087_16470, partial [Deltaproteobacteria bacterium]|nr:hypothetical protein [Deltaproteobacteria bacterium]